MPPATRAPQRGAPQKPAKPTGEKSSVVITPVGIMCFPHLWAPHQFDAKQEANYSMLLVFDAKKLEKDPAWAVLRKGVSAALSKKFGDQAKDLLQKGKLSLPWRDADEYSQYGSPFEPGMTMINLKSRNPPGVVNERSQPVMNQTDVYAGCLARASCLPWAFDSNGNKGCTLLLNNVQKAGDGERLSGVVPADQEFDALVEGGGEDEDLLS